MSVKLSTSRLRTAPGMGDRAGCYRCGQEGHWSNECPLDRNGYQKNGSEQNSDGYDPSGFGGRGRTRAYPDFRGAPEYEASYGHGFGQTSSMAGYRGDTGYESAMRYGQQPGYSMSSVADPSMARMYSTDPSYRGSASLYDPVPAFSVRRSPYEEQDPYGVVDYYEKYRANYGSSYFEERRAAPVPVPTTPATTAVRERVPPSSVDPYQCPPLPPPVAPVPSYYARERSPIRRVAGEAGGFTHERTRLPPANATPRSATFEHLRDPAAERARYTY